MVPTTQKHPAMESDGLYIFSKQIPFMLLVMLQVITEVFYFIYVNANLMICGVLIILIIFPRHPHDNMHYWYSRPHWQDSLPLSRVFFPELRRCSGALAANQLRLAPSEQKCQVCSQCVLTRVFAYVNLTHPVPLLLPLQTSPDNQMKYACSAIFTLSQQWPSADAPEEKFHAMRAFFLSERLSSQTVSE